MVAEGLSGPLCWAVAMTDEGESARIESAPAPASPTEDELAVAEAWQYSQVAEWSNSSGCTSRRCCSSNTTNSSRRNNDDEQ